MSHSDSRFLTTRRGFCASALTAAPLPLTAASQPTQPGPAIVRKAYVAAPKPTWPRPGVDVAGTRAEIESRLSEIERRHAGIVKFTGGELVRTMDDAQAWVKSLDREATDGNLVITITSGSDGMVRAIGQSGLPTLLFSRPYAGHAWGSFSEFAQAGNKADVLASSDFDDLDVYVRIFYTIHSMRKNKLIVVVPGSKPSRESEEYSKHFGTRFQYMSYGDVTAAYDRVSEAAAAKEAERYAAGALRVVEATPDHVRRATRFYLGVKELLARENAAGITMDCLGGLNRRELPAYPCVAWSRLDDEGLFGVCQADLGCAMTQMLLTPFSGKPGYLFNVVIDTSRNEIVQSHCTAPTAMHGLGRPGAPYILRTHLETNDGAALQVLLPIGETVTVSRFLQPRRLAASTAEVIANVDSDSGCRTQIRTRVKDARKMLANFKGIVHRVTYYGDYTGPLEKMSRLMAFDLVHEM